MTTEDASKLFVAGLPEAMNEENLRQIFEGVGSTVVSLSLPKDRVTGRPRGFGFVTLGSPEQAAAARDSLDGSLQGGRAISVRAFEAGSPRREPRTDGSPGASGSRTVYVGNLPYDVSQQDVHGLFESTASVAPMRVHLPVGPDGRARGFGFVTVGSEQHATSAVEKLADFMFRGRRLVVNLAHPKGERPDRGERSDQAADRGDRGERRPWRDAPAPPRDPVATAAPRDDFFEPSKPLEGRRARADVKPKKAKERRRSAERGKKARGGGSTWQSWADIDDDE